MQAFFIVSTALAMAQARFSDPAIRLPGAGASLSEAIPGETIGCASLAKLD
jgi:hypothetical protein